MQEGWGPQLTRLVIAVVASLAGVLATAVLWKPGVLLGAVMVPVIAELVQLTLGRSAAAMLAPEGPSDASTPRRVRRRPKRPELGAAVAIGLVGFAIVGGFLTVPPLVRGDPLEQTPLFGGDVPVVPSDLQDDDDTTEPDPGPAIDGDTDADGVLDDVDNCPEVHNPDQEDTNGKGRGDACDPDDDNDTVPDADDNCPKDINPDQEDTNGKGRGDACDPDDDNDTVPDAEDNCPKVVNAGQEDADAQDGADGGDECDDDDDNDGTADAADAFPTDPAEQLDSDGDGIGDNADVVN